MAGGGRGTTEHGVHLELSRFNKLLVRVIKSIRVGEAVFALEKGVERRGGAAPVERSQRSPENEILEPFGRD